MRRGAAVAEPMMARVAMQVDFMVVLVLVFVCTSVWPAVHLLAGVSV